MMRKSLVIGTFAMFLTAGVGQANNTQIFSDIQNAACDANVIQQTADAARAKVEDFVSRAEAAIRPPGSIGDLGCLDGLMEAPLDIFSNVGGLLGSLTSGLDAGFGDIGGQICSFANDKWQEVTQPLTGALNDLQLPSIGAGFNLGNLGGSGNTGSQNGSWTPPPSAGGGTTTPEVPGDDTQMIQACRIYAAYANVSSYIVEECAAVTGYSYDQMRRSLGYDDYDRGGR